MKFCNVCKEELSLDSFHKVKAFKDGRAYTCKECSKSRTRKWNASNKKRKAEQGKKHYKENKIIYIERARKAGWAKKNPERSREYRRKYYRENNGAARVAYYRHLKTKATPNWLTDDQKKEIEEFYWLCKDLKHVSGEDYHVDHIVPIKGENVCGLHVPWNLQVLPSDINIKKSNKFGY